MRIACRRQLAVAAAVGMAVAGLVWPASAAAVTGPGGRLGPPNTWMATGPMGAARSGQTATLLPDGKVLVAGGGKASAELYNPASRTFSAAGQMSVPRTNATATLLPSGEVLVAGGLLRGKRQLASAELYDPATGSWSRTGSMHVARSGQTATLLPDGKVLVAGGGCNGAGFYRCTPGVYGNSQRSAELYNPATGTWALTARMSSGRQFGTATLLPDGKVLVTGGRAYCDDGICVDTASAQLYDPATGTWAAAGRMRNAREQHTATLLGNGQVLVAGGANVSGISGIDTPESAELYNPATGTWTRTAPTAVAHVGQTATLLRNGWVLVAGGHTRVAEIYEPSRGIWVSPGAMTTGRTQQTATLLPGGYVLVTGGDGADGQPLTTAEEFLAGRGPLVSITPASLSFGGQQVDSTSGARTYRVANDGSADLLAGGVAVTGRHPADFRASTDCARAPVPPGGTCTVSVRFVPRFTGLRTAAAAVTDNAPRAPQSVAVSGFGGGPDAFVPVGPMATPRDHATATLLPDGDVLVAGGETSATQSIAGAELYDPATRTFSATGSLHTARSWAAAALLRDGQVLVVGGSGNAGNLSSAELYNPATGTWRTTAPMHQPGYGLTATLLPSGEVLVVGPDFGRRPPEVYNPVTATWADTGPTVAAHFLGTATLLRDGQVLAAGGHTSRAELYNPATDTWKATASLPTAIESQTATLLPDGDVLVAGGDIPVAGGRTLNDAELYDPGTGSWQPANPMHVARSGATATLLPDGTVLMAGGCSRRCDRAVGSAETFAYGGFLRTDTMTRPRMDQTATLLADGDVLVAGGDRIPGGRATASAELYTPILASMHPDSGPAGSRVTVSGSGFYAGETVRVLWDNKTVIGHAASSAAGTFGTQVTIPAAKPGRYPVDAVGARSGSTGNGGFTTFTVTG
jgi:N-acetylneuraminic acid mutarotase